MIPGSGRFVWFDLMTDDVEAAKRFYSDVVGWKTSRWPGGSYDMWAAGNDQIGGLMALKPDDRKAGMPPSWLGYVGVGDVDATVKQAQKLGGKVLAPGTDIPEVGRFAVLADPQGAVFALFSPLRQQGAPTQNDAPGHISWGELNTTDWKSAWNFYSQLLGWQKTSSMDMGPEYGEYLMFGTDPKASIGGMSNGAKIMGKPPHWLYYVNVKSADETVKQVPQKGGKVLNGPMDIPGGGRIAQFQDPTGAMFAVVSGGQQQQ